MPFIKYILLPIRTIGKRYYIDYRIYYNVLQTYRIMLFTKYTLRQAFVIIVIWLLRIVLLPILLYYQSYLVYAVYYYRYYYITANSIRGRIYIYYLGGILSRTYSTVYGSRCMVAVVVSIAQLLVAGVCPATTLSSRWGPSSIIINQYPFTQSIHVHALHS